MTALHNEPAEQELRRRLEEAEETLQAIRTGTVDAFVIDGPNGQQVFTLQGADRPYRIMVETMQEGAMVVTAEGIVLFGNCRMAELLQRSEGSLAGLSFFDLVAGDQDNAAAELLRTGLSIRANHDLDLRRPDGRRLPVHLTVSPLPVSDVPMACVIVTDMTPYREHEALRRAERRKDEFLATLAHELRNPLAPIRNALHLLRVTDPVDGRARSALEVMERQVRQMTHLVDDLLDLSRITRDQLTLRREPIDLSLVIRSAVETSQPLITEHRHQLIVELPDSPVWVEGDLTRLSQVFANLLNNAAKFTARGGRIELAVREDEGQVVTTVRDNGVGMTPETLATVFDMFTHASQGVERSYTGLGIGLTLARRLVELHGGSVEAASEGPERGSELTVRLPLAPPPAPQPSRAGAATRRAAGGYRILIVDDNRDSADTLGVLLETEGHQVRTAYDAATTFDLGADFAPEVVLLDLGMPWPDGFEICRRLREEEWGAGALVIAVSGWGQQADRRRTREAGFDEHLVKPLEPEALARLLVAYRSKGVEGGRSRSKTI